MPEFIDIVLEFGAWGIVVIGILLIFNQIIANYIQKHTNNHYKDKKNHFSSKVIHSNNSTMKQGIPISGKVEDTVGVPNSTNSADYQTSDTQSPFH